MKIIEINANDTLSLRQRLLRQKLQPQDCYFPGDDDDTTFHLGCLIDSEWPSSLVGIVSMYKRDNETIHDGCGYQIRAMASDENVRGKGVGLKLLNTAQTKALARGADYIWANARVSAVGFYTKAGYDVVGDEFEIAGFGLHFVVYIRNQSI
jgi:GNAT superfamily N-acetyltransferase